MRLTSLISDVPTTRKNAPSMHPRLGRLWLGIIWMIVTNDYSHWNSGFTMFTRHPKNTGRFQLAHYRFGMSVVSTLISSYPLPWCPHILTPNLSVSPTPHTWRRWPTMFNLVKQGTHYCQFLIIFRLSLTPLTDMLSNPRNPRHHRCLVELYSPRMMCVDQSFVNSESTLWVVSGM